MFPRRLIFLILCLNLRDSSVSAKECECGVAKEDQIDFRIINGKEVAPHSFPWLVYLTYNEQMYCGGAVINDMYILTAGHCVYGLQKENMRVHVGAHDTRNSKGIVLKVDYYRLHPDFTRYTNYDDNDIALIRVEGVIPFNAAVKPVCLPVPGNYEKNLVTIAGWGVTEGKAASSVLLASDLRVISDYDCSRAKYVGHLFKPGETFCAYGYKTDTCQGDSGSPLIHEIMPYKYQLLGVVSWGHGCAPEGIPGIYAKVVHYVPWILENTQDARYCQT